MDRELYLCLLFRLGRDPTQSLLVMALWLWLEHMGHRNLISKLRSLSHNLINGLAKEAVLCLRCLEAKKEPQPRIPPGGGLPLTATLTQPPLSLHFFIRKRFTAIAGIKSILGNICCRIFTDIWSHVFRITSTSRAAMVLGFPHPLRWRREEWDAREERVWRWRAWDDVTDEDKTMFLTFSRGFPVREEEVAYLFRSEFGEKSVVGIYMGSHGNGEQTLFATLVVDSVATVDRILGGKRIAKFRVNGKHIWARKYEPRD